MSTRFKIQQVAGALVTISCPDPGSVEWEWLSPSTRSLTGRIIQQGRLRCTVTWEYLSDTDYGALMTQWKLAQLNGQRIAAVALPPFAGASNATWPTCVGQGSSGGFVAFGQPKGTREYLYVKDVSIQFDDIEQPD